MYTKQKRKDITMGFASKKQIHKYMYYVVQWLSLNERFKVQLKTWKWMDL